MTSVNFKGFNASVEVAQLRELMTRCVVCNFQSARLTGFDLSGLTLISVDFGGADLSGTAFDGSVLCWYEIVKTQRQEKCDNLQGAQVTSASFRNVRICTDALEHRSCTPVDADALRRYSASPLSGATLP